MVKRTCHLQDVEEIIQGITLRREGGVDGERAVHYLA